MENEVNFHGESALLDGIPGFGRIISPFVLVGCQEITNMTINGLVFASVVTILGIAAAFASLGDASKRVTY